jgi:glucose-1-phosphate cytidylyltransferase
VSGVKVVILAGGLGTRLAEETDVRPKPMVEVGHRPILWHIMKHYSQAGFNEFVVALGYKGETIKRFFADYLTIDGDITVDIGAGQVTRHRAAAEDWTVHLVDTGYSTNTGGRIKRLAPWLDDERFMLTYGDGVGTVDIRGLLAQHQASSQLVTLTAVRPPSRFGGLDIHPDGSVDFTEKPLMGEGWINGGYMVVEPAVLERIDGDGSSFEGDVLEQLADEGRVSAFQHGGFWQPMDTLRDVRYLRSLWNSGEAPWVTWQ